LAFLVVVFSFVSWRSGAGSGGGGGSSSSGLSLPGFGYLNDDFTWTIFITPQDFVDIPGRTQRRAIHSWTLLRVCCVVLCCCGGGGGGGGGVVVRSRTHRDALLGGCSPNRRLYCWAVALVMTTLHVTTAAFVRCKRNNQDPLALTACGGIVDSGLDLNLVGMPLAGSLLDRAMRADTEFVRGWPLWKLTKKRRKKSATTSHGFVFFVFFCSGWPSF
jgi:hypothetical protein